MTKGSDSRPATMLDMMQVMFIGLKMTHQADMAWWAVFTPIYFTAILALLVKAVEK